MQKQQDDVDYGPAEYGTRSSDLGSFIPEGSYRPVPIVWFAGACFLQIPGLIILFVMLANKAPIFTWLTTAILSWAIGRWTFGRGMAQASTGWKAFTVAVLALNWLLVCLAGFVMHFPWAVAGL